MNYLLYILFFGTGVLCTFLIYKGKIFKPKPSLQNPSQPGADSKIDPEPQIIIKDNSEELSKFQKTIDNLYIVNELGRKVTSSLSLQQTFQHLYTTINSMMDAAVLELSVHNEITRNRKVFSNLESNKSEHNNPMSDWCFKNNREVFLSDAEKDYARYVFQPLVLPDGRIAKSVIIFPIINRDVVSGTLCVISFQKNSFDDYHREIIRLLLGYISVAIENAIRHEELNLTKIRAEQSEKFKEKFLANMSHEIRTPINAVTGMTRLLLEKLPRPDQLLYLESIRNASDSLLVIINDILDLSKIEAGKIELEKIDLSIFDIVKNIKEIMRFKAEEKGLAFDEHIDPKIPAVLIGDPTRLTQILINLVGNAIKFTSKGHVTINAIAVETEPDIMSSILFEVVDTGIGLTAEQQSKLFQDYSQASSETARKYGGTGLGLSICRQLVQIQGGEIHIKSEKGRGSTFSFVLSFPISKNKTVSKNEKIISKEMLLSLKGIRILLADDNEYNRIVVKETLQLKIPDVYIDEANDGSLAVKMASQNNYNIILMDLVMPEMDGVEATLAIRNELPSPKKDVHILALTASVVKSEIDRCFASGMNGFIPKPFKSHELIGAIYKALHNQSELVFEEALTTTEALPKGVNIDLNYLHEFTEGDEVRMQRYIDLFLTKIPTCISNIQTALDKNDFETIRIEAHSMKPQLRLTGVVSALNLAETIEQNCSEKSNLEKLPQLFADLKNICEKAILEMKEINRSSSNLISPIKNNNINE